MYRDRRWEGLYAPTGSPRALWILDASINTTMEPMRAFVGDMLPDEQRTTGFAPRTLTMRCFHRPFQRCPTRKKNVRRALLECAADA